MEVQMAEGGSTLRRSSTDKMIAGVVGGLARYFGMDATIAANHPCLLLDRLSVLPPSAICTSIPYEVNTLCTT